MSGTMRTCGYEECENGVLLVARGSNGWSPSAASSVGLIEVSNRSSHSCEGVFGGRVEHVLISCEN